MKYPKKDLFNYTDHREFIADTLKLNNITLRSFAEEFSVYFSHSTLSRLISKDYKGEYKWHIVYPNEKYYSFLTQLGLSQEESDFMIFLKILNDTKSKVLKTSLKRSLNNFKRGQNEQRYTKNQANFDSLSPILIESFSLLSKQRKNSILNSINEKLKAQFNRVRIKSERSKILNTINKIEDFIL